MYVPRPPRRYLVFGIAIIILMFHAGGIAAQQLVLPDIVLPDTGRGDVPMPEDFTPVGDDWSPSPPRFRRVYFIDVEPIDAAWENVRLENFPILEPIGLVTVPAWNTNRSVDNRFRRGMDSVDVLDLRRR